MAFDAEGVWDCGIVGSGRRGEMEGEGRDGMGWDGMGWDGMGRASIGLGIGVIKGVDGWVGRGFCFGGVVEWTR